MKKQTIPAKPEIVRGDMNQAIFRFVTEYRENQAKGKYNGLEVHGNLARRVVK